MTARSGGLFLALILSMALAGVPGLAQEPFNMAGLVILNEDGGFGYALVAFEEEKISGMELLRRSGVEPVTISFGGLGEGVCGIGRTGCAVDVCRRRLCQDGSADSPYWQTFAAGPDTGWAPLQLGASADRVSDGDVRLWAWTAGEPTVSTITMNDISNEVGATRDEMIWKGGGGVDDEGGAPLWLGGALIGVAGVVAATITLRTRSRPA